MRGRIWGVWGITWIPQNSAACSNKPADQELEGSPSSRRHDPKKISMLWDSRHPNQREEEKKKITIINTWHFLLLGYIYPFRSRTKDFTLHLILLEEEVLIELELIDIYLNNLFLSFQHNIHTSIWSSLTQHHWQGRVLLSYWVTLK